MFEISEKSVADGSYVIPSLFVFSARLTPGATLTCTCIPICAAISLQYICVSSRLRQEHEKWRRARSSVPRIGAVHSAVNGFCVYACVCVCLFPSVFITSGKAAWRVFPQEWRERCRPAPSSFPHLYLMTWALSLHLPSQLVLPLCLRIRGCYCTHCELRDTKLGAFRHGRGTDLSFCEVSVFRVKRLF